MRYEFETKLTPQELMVKAKEFFGGLGLEVTADEACCVTLVGGGGRVSVSAVAGPKRTVVNMEATEWDVQAKQFLKKYAR